MPVISVLLSLLALAAAPGAASSAERPSAAPEAAAPAQPATPSTGEEGENHPGAPTPAPLHPPGERIDLEVQFQGLPVGRGRIQVEPPSGAVQPIRLEARTTGVVSVVKLRQLLTTYVDTRTGLPRSASHDSVEGNYRATTTTDYDRARNRAVVVRRGSKSVNRNEVEAPAGTLDFLALVFKLRSLPLAQGQRHDFHVLAGRNVSKIVAEVTGREQVETSAGKFEAWKVRVPTNFSGEYSEKKPTFVWLSDDARRLVLRISVQLGIGRIEAQLAGYTPGVPTASVSR